MSITSLTFTLVNPSAPAAARPVTAAERPATAPTAATPEPAERHRSGGQPTRLVQAMMAALREIGFGTAASGASTDAPAATATPATDAAATDTPAAAPATTTAPKDGSALTSAVQQFAHALFQALRGDRAQGEPGNDDDGSRGERRHGHGHAYGHDGRSGWRNGPGYGDLSQRLTNLSQRLATPAATTAAPATATSQLSISITLDDGQPEPAAATATTEAAAPVSTATAASPAATATNPLLEAFGKLFAALSPEGSDAASADLGGKLRSFLDTLAQALKPDAMSGGLHGCRAGSLVDLTA